MKSKKILALKLTDGALGVGFYKVEYRDGIFFIDDKSVCEDRIIEFIGSLKNYIVTEFIIVHDEIKRFYDKSANTLRVMIINEDGNNPELVNSFIRFGTNMTGSVDNASAGGIFAIVDVESGKYGNAKRRSNNKIINVYEHPDSKIKIEGILPNWSLIKKELLNICLYIPGLKYMGFDIAITQEGFKIIEINSHQDVKWYQYYYPILKDNKASKFFKNLIKN